MNNGDMPASPLSGDAYQDYAGYDATSMTSYNPQCQGLTKREHFAAMAMQGILSSQYIGDFIKGRHDDVDVAVAEASVVHADALLNALLTEGG